MFRVVVVDGQSLIRQGLLHACEQDPLLHVIGEASTLADAEVLLKSEQPDVVLLDVTMPDGDGLDFACVLRKRHEDMGIVVLTMQADDNHLLRALEGGASAFISKSASSDEILAAIHYAAVAPNSFVAEGLAGALRRRSEGARCNLTDREATVLDLLKDGLSVSAVAKRMYISESTAKTHVASLYQKLHASNRAQAIMTALNLGLIRQSSSPEAPASASIVSLQSRSVARRAR
jgi:DNA-binding NarL/FixJ family response regulator